MDGLELQRRLKLQYPSLPVIFITAHYDSEIRQQAMSHRRMPLSAQAV